MRNDVETGNTSSNQDSVVTCAPDYTQERARYPLCTHALNISRLRYTLVTRPCQADAYNTYGGKRGLTDSVYVYDK